MNELVVYWNAYYAPGNGYGYICGYVINGVIHQFDIEINSIEDFNLETLKSSIRENEKNVGKIILIENSMTTISPSIAALVHEGKN